MSETITILSGTSVPVGSEVTEQFSIPYHENPVTFGISIRPSGTGFRSPSVSIDGQLIKSWHTGMSQSINIPVNLVAVHSVVKDNPAGFSTWKSGFL